VLSIGKLVAGAEEYYLGTVASGREDYYTGAGEAPGHWIGRGTPELGLEGRVDPDALRALLAGQDPASGRSLTAGRVNPTGRVAGFDATFSAPKSVSVVWALSDERTGELVRQAHDGAVSEALAYLECHALVARRGAGGEERIATSGMVAAAFRHRTSRAGDPQLHTHVLVANVVKGEDGRWSAPDARLLYFHARTAGFVYQAALRAHLQETPGLGFTAMHNGVAEVVGVRVALTRAFSTRRAEIEVVLARHGASSRFAGEIAALDTRAPKIRPPVDGVTLRQRWAAQAAQLGLDPSDLQRLVLRSRASALEPDADAFVAHLLSPEGLTAHESAFERRDVVRALAEQATGGVHVGELEARTESVLAARNAVFLAGHAPGGEGHWSTRELLALERRLLAGAANRRDESAGVAGAQALVDALLAHPMLSHEQRIMVERLVDGGHGVDVVVGVAGAGKTTALAAARQAWQRSGFAVVGTALSARAAAGLDSGAGIPSVTVARFVQDGPELTRRHVVVVDEAGMVGTRDLGRLLGRASAAGAKVVLVGDHRQLPEIAAGGAFAALAERLDAIELTENRRQDEAWERTGLAELRSGEVARALEAYGNHERLHVAPSADAVQRALVAGWLGARGDGPVRMLAVRRADVFALNDLARQALLEEGRLGTEVAKAGEQAFALGDEVVCLRNDASLGVLNGTRGTVVAPGVAGGVALLVGDDLRYLPGKYLEAGHLDYSYAVTVHKSQGETVERAFVYGTSSLYREAGYVALSRARVRTDVYVPGGAFEDSDANPDLGTRLRSVLSVSRAKSLATPRERRQDRQADQPNSDDQQLALIRRILDRTQGPPEQARER
jgi:conjugative relaxase-like TrwC/TraI family protein